ncbi:MAG: CYTH domain-containing protein [Pseudomonadota bacterium]
MGVEIERKFLLRDARWRDAVQDRDGQRIQQAFLSTDPDRTVRVRVVGQQGWLTIKARGSGATRPEFEYEIPASEAEALINKHCLRPIIDKTRYLVVHDGNRWEIDEFHAENAGLVLAELELLSEDQGFARPEWLGDEVTEDFRYANSSLALRPFLLWDE